MSAFLDQADLDTWLARQLWQTRRFTVDELRPLLEEARAGRGATLARLLVDRGLILERELQATLQPAVDALSELTASGSQAWSVGALVDGYRLVRRLASGGMGQVWEAEEEGTHVRRALKVLPPGADPECLLRFRREGQGQARVDVHPNVVRVHSARRAAGREFLVLDLLADGDLEDRLRDGPLAPRRAAEVVAGLARGLAYVHARGVLHRDLKPANVLFAGDVPQLTDFGVAKVSGEFSLTASGTFLGTPAYMAPEQIDPTRGEADERADVYGLGAILYRSLGGRPPYSGIGPMATLLAVLGEAPPPLRSLRPEVPQALEAICLRAMAKDPAERTPSALALERELSAWLGGAGSVSRGPLWIVLAGIALLAVGVGAAVFATQPRPTPPRPSQAPTRADSPAGEGEESAPLSPREEERERVEAARAAGRMDEARWRLARLAKRGDLAAMVEVADLARESDAHYARFLLLEAAVREDRAALEALVVDASVASDANRIAANILLGNAKGMRMVGSGGARGSLKQALDGLREKIHDETQELQKLVDKGTPEQRDKAFPKLLLRFDHWGLATRGDVLALARDVAGALRHYHLAAQEGSARAGSRLFYIYLDPRQMPPGVRDRLKLNAFRFQAPTAPRDDVALAGLRLALKEESRAARDLAWTKDRFALPSMHDALKTLAQIARELGY